MNWTRDSRNSLGTCRESFLTSGRESIEVIASVTLHEVAVAAARRSNDAPRGSPVALGTHEAPAVDAQVRVVPAFHAI